MKITYKNGGVEGEAIFYDNAITAPTQSRSIYGTLKDISEKQQVKYLIKTNAERYKKQAQFFKLVNTKRGFQFSIL